MRRHSVLSAAALAALTLACAAGSRPASAQGFFQQLFGFGAPPPPAPAPSPMLTPGGQPYAARSAVTGPFSRRPGRDDDDDSQHGRGGTYKTVCVRMCDGYYFPISNSTQRRMFYRDQMRCRASCGQDARLFFMPTHTTDIDGALDLDGRVYGRMATAYTYRKSLVAGCQCKAEPWSEAELARHEGYAALEAEQTKATAPRMANATAMTAPAEQVAAEGAPPVTAEPPAALPAATPPIKLVRAAAAPRPAQTLAQAQAQASKAVNRGPFAVKPQAMPVVVSSGSGGFGGFLGPPGASSMTWPGDTPRRRP